MQQTEKYKLNIIETTDTFGPEALNENARTTERELAALEAAHAADKAALAADAAANKSELQAAVQSAQSGASSALSAHAADRLQHAFVKLGKVEVPAKTTQTFSVANPADYAMVIIDIDIKNPAATPFAVKANGTGAGATRVASNSSRMHGLDILMASGGVITGLMFTIHHSISLSSNTPIVGFLAGVAWSALSALSFDGCDSDSTVNIYAVKA